MDHRDSSLNRNVSSTPINSIHPANPVHINHSVNHNDDEISRFGRRLFNSSLFSVASRPGSPAQEEEVEQPLTTPTLQTPSPSVSDHTTHTVNSMQQSQAHHRLNECAPDQLEVGDILIMFSNDRPYHALFIVDTVDSNAPIVHSAFKNINGAVRQSMRGVLQECRKKQGNTFYNVYRVTDAEERKILPACCDIAKKASVKTGSQLFFEYKRQTGLHQPIELQMPFGDKRLEKAELNGIKSFDMRSLFRAVRSYVRAEYLSKDHFDRPAYTNLIGEKMPEKRYFEPVPAAFSKNKGLSCSQMLTQIFHAGLIKYAVDEQDLQIPSTLVSIIKAGYEGKAEYKVKAKDLTFGARASQPETMMVVNCDMQKMKNDIAFKEFLFPWDPHSCQVSDLVEYMDKDTRFEAVGTLSV